MFRIIKLYHKFILTVAKYNIKEELNLIKKITKEINLNNLVKIYDSANLLFPKEKRCPGTNDIFIQQLEENENYLYLDKKGKPVAFMSYCIREEYYELTSLYVQKDYQKKGIGEELIKFFEKQVPGYMIILIRVLKNAPWAIKFYIKQGYLPIDDKLREKIINIKEKPWTLIFYKNV